MRWSIQIRVKNRNEILTPGMQVSHFPMAKFHRIHQKVLNSGMTQYYANCIQYAYNIVYIINNKNNNYIYAYRFERGSNNCTPITWRPFKICKKWIWRVLLIRFPRQFSLIFFRILIDQRGGGKVVTWPSIPPSPNAKYNQNKWNNNRSYMFVGKHRRIWLAMKPGMLVATFTSK